MSKHQKRVLTMIGKRIEIDLIVLMIQSIAKQPIWKLVKR
jgi:hypothetical protein